MRTPDQTGDSSLNWSIQFCVCSPHSYKHKMQEHQTQPPSSFLRYSVVEAAGILTHMEKGHTKANWTWIQQSGRSWSASKRKSFLLFATERKTCKMLCFVFSFSSGIKSVTFWQDRLINFTEACSNLWHDNNHKYESLFGRIMSFSSYLLWAVHAVRNQKSHVVFH